MKPVGPGVQKLGCAPRSKRPAQVLRGARLRPRIRRTARMAELTPDYSKRDCSLPPGCKDLIDVLRLQKAQWKKAKIVGVPPPIMLNKPGVWPSKPKTQQIPGFAGTIQIKGQVTVKELAALLGRKPFEIMASLIDLCIIATPSDRLDFDLAARVAAKYGYIAKKAAS